ncbi:hypothetical protein DMN91_010337 [Ooceraea biroi]|uniref:Uncharacterized protein n=1 Tax=Ooceraea biroi TaxID=2015173 RepID=A0A3L8DCL3_OOCBI|nr:hypothetical protein DMN91_010337 [Ooceraea biroi]
MGSTKLKGLSMRSNSDMNMSQSVHPTTIKKDTFDYGYIDAIDKEFINLLQKREENIKTRQEKMFISEISNFEDIPDFSDLCIPDVFWTHPLMKYTTIFCLLICPKCLTYLRYPKHLMMTTKCTTNYSIN